MSTQPAILSPRRFNIDEYEALWESGILGHQERVELLDGLIYPKWPKETEHERALGAYLVTSAGLGFSNSDPSEKPMPSSSDVRLLPASMAPPGAIEFVLRRFSLNEYERMAELGVLTSDARVELLDGHIVTMSPSGSRHSYVVSQLARMLIKSAPNSVSVRVQEPLILEGSSQPEPDLSVVTGPKAHWERHPEARDALLVVEVSESSLAIDHVVKLPMYLEAGMPEVWLVDVANRSVQVHRNDTMRKVRVGAIAPRGAPEMSVDIEALFGGEL